MKTIMYLALFALVAAGAILGLLYVFESITVDEFKDYATKIGLAVIILAVAASLIKLLLNGNNQTPVVK